MNNMRKQAAINDYLVTEISMVADEDMQEYCSKHQMVLDIEDEVIQPQIGWALDGSTLAPVVGYEMPQIEKDFTKYMKRAKVKDIIISEMASENMQRVRTGVWTVSELISLTQDAELKQVLDDISTLSYELAVMKIQELTNPLITTDIKTAWSLKLQSYFY